MFDKLIESEPQGADFKDRRRYFMVSSVVVGILFTTAVVISIFAADYGLGTAGFELVEMIAPDDIKPVEPETPRVQPSNPDRQHSSTLPTLQADIAAIQESPTSVSDTVSTVKNKQMARPDFGKYRISTIDSQGGDPGGIGRGPVGTGPAGLGVPDTSSTSSPKNEEEETGPPPIIKKPHPPKTTVSKGVLNGHALSLPKPNYSAIAKATGAQGQVAVQVTIDESGRVISANAVSGHLMLRADAERAARAAKFSPTFLSDVPVKVTGVITYNFLK